MLEETGVAGAGSGEYIGGIDRSFNGQYGVPKTLVFATTHHGRENMRYSWPEFVAVAILKCTIP
jgi:hypothetical protein